MGFKETQRNIEAHITYANELLEAFLWKKMDKETDKGKGSAGERGFRTPGLRGAQTTTLFRAVNPELFIKPNKPVMVFGLVTITLCVGYLGYLHAMKDNDQQLYEAIDSKGERYMKRKTSKWD